MKKDRLSRLATWIEPVSREAGVMPSGVATVFTVSARLFVNS